MSKTGERARISREQADGAPPAYLTSPSARYIEELHERYRAEPETLDPSWRYFFDGYELATVSPKRVSRRVPAEKVHIDAEAGVSALIHGYRELGIHLANINPLEGPATSHPLLQLSEVGLGDVDLERKFSAAKLAGFASPASLGAIIAALRETYCGSIGVEFTHIEDPAAREWLRGRMESTRNRPMLSVQAKKAILERLTAAETFERFLHTRYVAQKRFSLEGAESLIPMLDCLIDSAAELGMRELVLGMAHRGRLNVLANIFGKKPEYIFSEFEGVALDPTLGDGDVKYHLGYNADFTTPHGKKVALTLAFNPSHLEFVDPVVEGMAYGRQMLARRSSQGGAGGSAMLADEHGAQTLVVPVLIHGDAAFAGQGVVYETIQMSAIRGYGTGGTIHVVINNQIGFTATPEESRSTTFATDLGKMLSTPILHVNGDDAEAAYYAMKLAVEYRQMFHRDILIDLVCYRKYGHNEGDEPGFTQPLMYEKIRNHLGVRERYARKLEGEGVITLETAQMFVQQEMDRLTAGQAEARAGKKAPRAFVFDGPWKGLRRATTDQDLWLPVHTAVAADVLRRIGDKLYEVPVDFHVHPKLARLLEQRRDQIRDGVGLEWATGEELAYGSLLVEGTPVRLSGQDSQRGTFSHRHSVLYDYQTNARYVPLNFVQPNQASFSAYNSILSETAVLGFEWGHSIIDPRSLIIWEAQFGDFANGAQVVIDQFIASAETKWQRSSGIVLYLPHGYEGQGPEHSSARIERFLQLCAQNNMQVCNPTNPAQLFHLLRRQLKRDFRKPLVVMTPKSLLRQPLAVSKLNEFSTGTFSEVIDDPVVLKNARRVLFCSGKIYYDLLAERTARRADDVALVRIEQLYPWPRFQVRALLSLYNGAREVAWVQEEPQNQGAWLLAREALGEDLPDQRKLFYVGRVASAAPAVGSHKVHERQQKAIVEQALAEEALR